MSQSWCSISRKRQVQLSCIEKRADWVQDHWVANHTRDALIAARGKPEGDLSSSKPKMVIDSNGVGHAFCIRKFAPFSDGIQHSIPFLAHFLRIFGTIHPKLIYSVSGII